jgi:EAL domain-containing protein (putative c-di-GMP-specific phosphodiesterase class I)/ActR/RegA family two-component response regulator
MSGSKGDAILLSQADSSSFSRARILVADDDDATCAFLAKGLRSANYEVVTAANGREAIALIDEAPFDAIVTDISMPEMTGIQLLRSIRGRDADVPVVLVTGSPDVESAMQAVRLGALVYFTKPIDLDELKRVMARAVRLGRIARLKQEALALVSGGGLGGSDLLALEASFERALDTLWIAYQPIVRASDGSLFGYEALMRGEEASLPHPGAILDAAERLDRVAELGRAIRAAVARAASTAPAEATLFINLHSRDLMDPLLFSRDAPLQAVARHVVLEITERSALDGVSDARARIAKLREQGFRIALDDLGAGYSGLTSFVTLEPELVKLDLTLVRDIDSQPLKQALVRAVTLLCRELGLTVVAEGVETRAERDVVVACGCDLIQGYLLGRPGRPFPKHVW